MTDNSGGELSDDGTVRKVGKQGNVYEDNPAAVRYPRAAARVLRQRQRGEAAAVLETTSAESKVLNAGGEAAPDYGAGAGARNALNFHAWRKGEDKPEGDR